MRYIFSDGSSMEKYELLEQLFTSYKELMYSAAYEILHDRFEAEDAVENVFEKLIKNNFLIESISCNKTRSFLVIISRNAAISIYNANKKNKNLVFIDESEIEDDNALPLNALIDQENIEEIGELLLDLDSKYTDVIYMKYVFGYTDAEIASLLGIVEASVRSRLSRGKKLLKQLLISRKEENSNNE